MAAKKFHEISKLFPLMRDDELEQLKADIEENGQREPIWLHPDDDSILDGRNRYTACCDLGVEPKFVYWDGEGSAAAFVISENLRRKHLDASQRAMVAKNMLPLLEKEAKKRQGKRTDLDSELPGKIAGKSGDARDQAAQAVGVNPRYVSDAKAIAAADPKLADQVASGEVTIPQAKREIKKRKGAKKKKAGSKTQNKGKGGGREKRFKCIYIDPPKPMTLGKLKDLPVSDLAHQGGVHVWLWTTWQKIRKGVPHEAFKEWGLTWAGEIVWLKDASGGEKWIRTATEVLVLGVCKKQLPPQTQHQRGSISTSVLKGCRPAEFLEAVEKVSPTPRVWLFNTSARDGWALWDGGG